MGIVLSQQATQSLGTDIRVSNILRGFDSTGIESTIFAPTRNASDGRDGSPFILGPRELQFDFVQRLVRQVMAAPALGNAIFWSPAVLRRQIESLAKDLIALEPDVDVLQGEQQLASLAAVQAGRTLGVPVVADLHGIWSEELVAYGSIRRGGRADRNIRALDSAIAKAADHVTVVSTQMQDYLVSELSADPSRISVVLNGAIPQVSSVPMRPNPRRLVFAGMLSPIQNIKLLLEAVSIVHEKYPRIELYLTAKGELTAAVRNQCERMGLPARFFWFEGSERFFQFLASCDVGLLPANNDPGRQMAYPAKLYSYMAVGLPIVTNRIGSWSDIVEAEQIGIVTDNTPSGFAGGIMELLENPSRIHWYGERALALLRTKYAYAKEIEKFAAIYSNLCGPRVGSAPTASLESR